MAGDRRQNSGPFREQAHGATPLEREAMRCLALQEVCKARA
jgi:hypothetical protein